MDFICFHRINDRNVAILYLFVNITNSVLPALRSELAQVFKNFNVELTKSVWTFAKCIFIIMHMMFGLQLGYVCSLV